MLLLPTLIGGVIAAVAIPAPPVLSLAAPEGGESSSAEQGSAGEGKYDGVAPGSGTKNPLPAAPPSDVPHLIWSGFQMRQEGSRVFFQTTGPVTFEVKETAGDGKRSPVMSVFLRNCRIHLKNNQRNLDTRFFATPVRGVTATQRRKDVELRISFKTPTSSTPRSEPGPDGTQFLVLDFPPGRPASEPTGPSAAPSAEPIENPSPDGPR